MRKTLKPSYPKLHVVLNKLIFLVAISISVTVLVSFSYAEATPTVKLPSIVIHPQKEGLYHIIALMPSKTCQAAIKAGNTDCPNILKLIPYDTTDQKYYGKIISDNHTAFRTKGLIKNPEITNQDTVDYVICVLCPKRTLDHAKVIEIVPKSFKWISRADNIIINNTRYEYQGMHVKSDCSYAMIPFWMLNDTITYLKSDCKGKLDLKQSITKPYSKLTYDGRQYQQDKWLAEAKKHKTENCIKSDKC